METGTSTNPDRHWSRNPFAQGWEDARQDQTRTTAMGKNFIGLHLEHPHLDGGTGRKAEDCPCRGRRGYWVHAAQATGVLSARQMSRISATPQQCKQRKL